MNNLNKTDNLSVTEQVIVSKIKNEPVPVISQNDIYDVCKLATSYYTEKQSTLDKTFWKVVFSCFSSESIIFWLMSAFLLGSCVVFSLSVTGHGIEPIAIITALAPVPVIIFAIRELQYRDGNLIQIEKTCKYAPQKIYFARLWLGMVINSIWVLMSGAVFLKYENLIQMYFCSFTALFLIGAVTLVTMSISDNSLPLSFIMTAWILGAVFLMSSEEFIHIITTMSIWLLAIILLFSVTLFVFVTIKTTKKLYA